MANIQEMDSEAASVYMDPMSVAISAAVEAVATAMGPAAGAAMATNETRMAYDAELEEIRSQLDALEQEREWITEQWDEKEEAKKVLEEQISQVMAQLTDLDL